MGKDWRKLNSADVITVIILFIFLGSILGYVMHSIKTKGTTCTSCTSCPAVKSCNKDTIKNDLLHYYKTN